MKVDLSRALIAQAITGVVGGIPQCNTTFKEFYNYNSPGARVGKRLQVARTGVTNPWNLDGIYTYDNEGKMLTQQYPTWWNGSSNQAGVTLTNTYDTMGRLATLGDGSTNVISSTTYGPAGELQGMSGAWGSESRSYNAMLQMTYLGSGGVSFAYNYSSTQNNGKIGSQHDYVSGEDITYTYDSLNRLATAVTSDNPSVPQWGQSYDYDGFGSLTYQHRIKGTAPDGPEPQTPGYDLNGNSTGIANPGGGGYFLAGWDVENRLTGVGNFGPSGTRYAYAPDNKRVWRGVWDGSGSQTVDEVTFWSVTGQRVATYSLIPFSDSSSVRANQTGVEYYFGGKLIKNAGGYVHADRLGSVGKYFPYGQERPSATANGTEKFGTYFRDADTGLDYAVNRYHAPGQGRFLSPDPYQASGGPNDPGSWNRYAYVGGDPVNRKDPSGRDWCWADWSFRDDPECDLWDELPDPGSWPAPDPNPGGGGSDPGDLAGWARTYTSANTSRTRVMNLQFSPDCLNLLQGIEGANHHKLVLSDLVIAAKDATFEIDPNMKGPRGTVVNAETFQHRISLRPGLESSPTFGATILHEILHSIGWNDGVTPNFGDDQIKQSLKDMGKITDQELKGRGTSIITKVLNDVCFK